MANLDTFPDELLLDIAWYIYRNPSPHGGCHDLSALARAAPRCRNAAQEVLFRSPTIQKPAIHPFLPCPENRQILLDHNSLACLLRSLIARPGLAEKVRNLRLCCLHPREQSIDGYQPALWISNTSPPTNEERWLAHFIRNGPNDIVAAKFYEGSRRINQFAMAGFILRLCPNLETLDLEVYRVVHREHEQEEYGCYELEPQPFSMQDMIGVMYRHHRGKVARIGNLANLTRLSINSTLSPCLTHLPGLKHLQLSVLPCSRRNRDHACFRNPPSDVGAPAVTSMVLNLHVDVLRHVPAAERPLHWRHVAHMRSMSHLKNLDIRLYRNPHCPRPVYFRNGYDNILNWIPSPTVKVLIVDTADVDAKFGGSFGFDILWPLTSLMDHLPNLQRLVVPQGMLVRVHRLGASFCSLPNTLEAIEVIDSTRALNFWAYTIAHRCMTDQLPHLKKIVLWLCRHTAFLGEDSYLDYIVSTHRLLYGAPPGVWLSAGERAWRQLENLGVQVSRNREPLGWRR